MALFNGNLQRAVFFASAASLLLFQGNMALSNETGRTNSTTAGSNTTEVNNRFGTNLTMAATTISLPAANGTVPTVPPARTTAAPNLSGQSQKDSSLAEQLRMLINPWGSINPVGFISNQPDGLNPKVVDKQAVIRKDPLPALPPGIIEVPTNIPGLYPGGKRGQPPSS